MEYTRSNHHRHHQTPVTTPNEHQAKSPKMSMLAMAAPSPHAPFRKDYFSSWEDRRQTDYAPSRPRSDPERIALPSIHQAFPELRLGVVPPEGQVGTPSSTTSPIAGPPGTLTPPEYVHSPTSQNKRRRLSFDDEQEERASRVPRLYSGPQQTQQQTQTFQRRDTRPLSPVTLSGGPRSSTTDSWTGSRTSPFLPGSSGPPPMRSPVTMDQNDDSRRPTLPSLPLLNFDRPPVQQQAPPPAMHHHHHHHHQQQTHHHHGSSHSRAMSGDEYAPQHPHQDYRAQQQQQHQPQGGYPPYPYHHPQAHHHHHPSRSQSMSMGQSAMQPPSPMDRMPFSPSGYSPYHEYMRLGDMGGMGVGDNKQRKRRGNLPKETTDKLRAWFLAHLVHPYPTEDEKQELMRQTGLQMNQISNWFINARRRQLPAMINNARAESDAMGRLADGCKVLPTTEYDVIDKRDSPLSDDGPSGMHYHDDHLHRRVVVGMKRGSV